MPVKFHGHSEYEKKFKWRDSYKSASYTAPSDVAAPDAGLASIKSGFAIEPPLQRKKRVGDYQATNPIATYEGSRTVDDGYILLGNQDKFAQNVKYRSKSVERPKQKKQESSPPQQQPYQQPYRSKKAQPTAPQNGHHGARGERNGVPHTPDAPRRENQAPPPPPPRPVYNTGAPKLKARMPTPKAEDIVPAGRPTGAQLHRSERQSRRDADREEARPAKERRRSEERKIEARAAEERRQERQRQEHRADEKREAQRAEVRRQDQRAQEKRQAQRAEERRQDDHRPGREEYRPVAAKKEPVKSKTMIIPSKNKMNEFTQTNVKKGVAASGPEATADYALQYKSGVAAPRTRGPKRMSEYAMQFTWKKGMAASPLLAAEQVVYKNNPAVPPASRAAMPSSSTYNANYKPWNLIKSTPDLAQAFADDQASEITPAKKAKESHPGKKIPEPTDPENSDPEYFDPEDTADKPIVPLRRSRSVEDVSDLPPAGVRPVTTEEDKRLLKESVNPQRLHFPHGKAKSYKSTYNSNYRAPKQFVYEEGTWKGAAPAHLEGKVVDAAPDKNSTWFAEVQELRRRAAEYKHRARGTHFSRSHVGQLFAVQADLWDTDSTPTPSSQLSEALDLQEARSTGRRSGRSSTTRSNAATASTGTLTARTASTTYDNTAYNDAPSDEEEGQGRITTPELRASRQGNLRASSGRVSSQPRHHLARTTPMVGGALLTAPVQATIDAETESSMESASYRPIAGQQQQTDVDTQLKATYPLGKTNTGKQSKHQHRHHQQQKRPSTANSVLSDHSSRVPLGKTHAVPLVLTNQVRCTCSVGEDSSDGNDSIDRDSNESRTVTPQTPVSSDGHADFIDTEIQTEDIMEDKRGTTMSHTISSAAKRRTDTGTGKRSDHPSRGGLSKASERVIQDSRKTFSKTSDVRSNKYQHPARTSPVFSQVPKSFKPQPTYDHLVYAPVRPKTAPVSAPSHADRTSSYHRMCAAPATHDVSHVRAAGVKAAVGNITKNVAPKDSNAAGVRNAQHAHGRPFYTPSRPMDEQHPPALRKVPATADGRSRADRILEELEKQYGLYQGERPQLARERGAPAPAFGMPTRDSHPLMDEEGPEDAPLSTQYTYSPPIPAAKRAVPATIHEGMGETYSKPPVKKNSWLQVDLDDVGAGGDNVDDDMRSVSALSVCSSTSSLASEVLDRARKRRDQFWKY